MTTIIGIDPHPQHHTVAALAGQGQVLGVQQFPNSPQGLEACLAWLEDLEDVQVAVEGPTQTFFASWLTRLLAEGLLVVPIATQQVRERRGRRKTDPQDAVLIARVLQAEPDRPALTSPAWLRSLQELTRTRRHLAQHLQAHRMRLRTVQTPTVQTSLERVVTALAGEVQELEGQILQQVQALAPQLLKLLGVGPVIAGVLLAEVGDIRRFQSKDHFASYCGAAPVPWESGASKHVRVNRGGNRRLNWALHIIARTRLRLDQDTQALVARKVQEGKTRREAIRVLKTYLARQLYSVLLQLLPPEPKHIATS